MAATFFLYSLYPELITGFLLRVYRQNLSFSVFKALLADSNLNFGAPFSLMALLDSLHFDVYALVPYLDFFFPKLSLSDIFLN